MAEAKERAAPPPLHPTRKHLAESQRNVWDCDIEVGTSPEDLLNPAYWAHNAREFRVMDRIEAHADDGTWWAEYLVQDAGLNFAKVALLRKIDLAAITPQGSSALLAGHVVEWGGKHSQFRVVREVDRKVLKEGCKTKADAFVWLENYGRSIAGTSQAA